MASVLAASSPSCVLAHACYAACQLWQQQHAVSLILWGVSRLDWETMQHSHTQGTTLPVSKPGCPIIGFMGSDKEKPSIWSQVSQSFARASSSQTGGLDRASFKPPDPSSS